MTTVVTDLAREILAANRYAVIATATPDGEPWVSPVYFVSQGLDALLWLSRPESQHSQLIAANERVAVTVFGFGFGAGQAWATADLSIGSPTVVAHAQRWITIVVD